MPRLESLGALVTARLLSKWKEIAKLKKNLLSVSLDLSKDSSILDQEKTDGYNMWQIESTKSVT